MSTSRSITKRQQRSTIESDAVRRFMNIHDPTIDSAAEDTHSSSQSTTFTDLLRQLRGKSSPEAISAAAQAYINGDFNDEENELDFYLQARRGPGAYQEGCGGDDDDGFRDYETVSSISRMSAITDVIILSDPEFGGGQILSLRPPQPDDASDDRPMQPPMRSIVTMGPKEEDPSLDTIFLGDGVLKTCVVGLANGSGEFPGDDGTMEEIGSSPLPCHAGEIVSKRKRPWARITFVLCCSIVLIGGAMTYLPNFLGHSNAKDEPAPLAEPPAIPTITTPEETLPTNSKRDSEISSTAPPTSSAAPSMILPLTHAPTQAPTPTIISSSNNDLSTQQPTMAPSTTSPTVVPTMSPTPPPTTLESGIQGALAAANPLALAQIRIPSSPQNLAYQFLLQTTIFSVHTPRRIVQRYVLAVLYYATNGEEWERQDKWLQDLDECKWYNSDVPLCSPQGDVTRLRLHRNNLVGELPDELGLLLELRELQLGGNNLVGVMPATLGQLTKLERLDLSWTGIDGHIPAELGDAVSLRHINLVGAWVDGPVPSEFGLLVNLEELLLVNTELTGAMPQSVCGLKVDELWADCDQVSCPCCNYCCYHGFVSYCEYV